MQQQGMQVQEKATKEVAGAVQKPIADHLQGTQELLQQVYAALSEVIGGQTVGFERGEDGKVSGVKRRNGQVTPISRDEQGRMAGLQ
jgi:hypothetical protein